jgi:AcrR family transcriptional regulator
MLGRSGWAGLSLRGLARQLGVSLATIQRHFATKDELWRAAVDAALPLRDLPSHADAADADAAGRFADNLRALIARSADRPGITAAVWNDQSPGAQSRIEHLTARSQAVLDGGRAQIAAGAAAGVLRPIEPEVLLALVGLGITSLASSTDALRQLFGIDIAQPAQRDRLADALADLLLHGVLASEPVPAGPTTTQHDRSTP